MFTFYFKQRKAESTSPLLFLSLWSTARCWAHTDTVCEVGPTPLAETAGALLIRWADLPALAGQAGNVQWISESLFFTFFGEWQYLFCHNPFESHWKNIKNVDVVDGEASKTQAGFHWLRVRKPHLSSWWDMNWLNIIDSKAIACYGLRSLAFQFVLFLWNCRCFCELIILTWKIGALKLVGKCFASF